MVELSPRAHRLHLASGLLAALLLLAALVVVPLFSKDPLTRLQQIQQKGELRVLSRNAASTWYQGSQGEDGLEYQLARLFSEFIGVELRMIEVDSYDELYNELLFGDGDIAAAGLSEQDIDPRKKAISFGPAYHRVSQQLIYRKGSIKRPRKIQDLRDGVVEVIAGTSEERLMRRLKTQYSWLVWRVNKDMGAEELIELVDQGVVDYMLGDSHEIALQRRFFPELRIAFELGRPKLLRWAFKRGKDKSLDKAVRQFFELIRKDGRLDQLIHRYYSHVARFNYSDIQTFLDHARQRLPKYRPLFERIAREEGLEWQLLAAISYQESLWDEKAISPTGVRGLMMLTLNTAKHLGIENRLDPEQSILGGARYFKQVLKKIPERIPQPDRTWLALAAYNVGYGHLEDARKITEMNGGDPDKWIDVKKSLPLLSRKKWYKKAKHGYARGHEPVKYVENIRKYHELLVWMDKRSQGQDTLPEPPAQKEDLNLPPSF
jgi:membrane-bound lytic murein transglycosylase F